MAEEKKDQWNADSIATLIGAASGGLSSILSAKQGKATAESQAAQASSQAAIQAAAAAQAEASRKQTFLIIGGVVSVMALVALVVIAKRK